VISTINDIKVVSGSSTTTSPYAFHRRRQALGFFWKFACLHGCEDNGDPDEASVCLYATATANAVHAMVGLKLEEGSYAEEHPVKRKENIWTTKNITTYDEKGRFRLLELKICFLNSNNLSHKRALFRS
jgi:hypothetical protein